MLCIYKYHVFINTMYLYESDCAIINLNMLISIVHLHGSILMYLHISIRKLFIKIQMLGIH